MQKTLIRILCFLTLALWALPTLAIAQDCLPERLTVRANPTDYWCAPNPRLAHPFPDGGESEFYENSNAILILQQAYVSDAWTLTTDGAARAKKTLVPALLRNGFNVFIWEDLDSTKLDVVMQDSLRYLGNSELNRLFFYYYGHGLNIPGRGFHFIPVDARGQDESGAEEDYVRYAHLRGYFDRASVRHAFYAFEGCNAGAIFEDLSGNSMRSTREPESLRKPDAMQSQRQYFTATDATSNAPATGDFADAMAIAMTEASSDSNGDGYIVGREMIDRVRNIYAINGLSEPIPGQLVDGTNAEIILGRWTDPGGTADPEPQPDPDQVVSDFFDARKVYSEQELRELSRDVELFRTGWIHIGSWKRDERGLSYFDSKIGRALVEVPNDSLDEDIGRLYEATTDLQVQIR